MVRIFFVVILSLHGLIHSLGVAKAFGFAQLPQLTQAISRPWGYVWLVAGGLMLATATMAALEARGWWWVGAVALLFSQTVIVVSWNDAKFGTIANLMVLMVVGWAIARHGPWGLRSVYERALGAREPNHNPVLLTEADLLVLPEPVRAYIRKAGVVGQPRVHRLRAKWTGRIRSGPAAAWMSFTADQLNTFDPPRRFFLMDATMKGFPVDVLHAFDERGATMRVRLLSMKTMVDASGPELTRAETVTLFNDLCFLAPGELVRASIRWEPLDTNTVRAHYTQQGNTITARLTFNDAAELTDFSSDDRNPDPRGLAPPTRWTTPARDYGQVGPARVLRHAETHWHPRSGEWSYGEFALQTLTYN